MEVVKQSRSIKQLLLDNEIKKSALKKVVKSLKTNNNINKK